MLLMNGLTADFLVAAVKAGGGSSQQGKKLLANYTKLVDKFKVQADQLAAALTHGGGSAEKHAKHFRDAVIPAMSALSPAVVAAIDDLELSARRIVEGLRTGAHRSPFHGFTSEFRQHRPYRAGDDLKHLDWKLFGRSDRLYSRQFRETTNVSVMLVLDTTGSMAYSISDGSGGTTTRLAASICKIMAAGPSGMAATVTIFGVSGAAMRG